jgi:hypothetical protein
MASAHKMVCAEAHVIEASGNLQSAVEAIRCRGLEARHILVVLEVHADFFGDTIDRQAAHRQMAVNLRRRSAPVVRS